MTKRSLKKLTCFPFLLLILTFQSLNAQTYIGFGLHISPKMSISNCCNEFINTQPNFMISESLSLKKHFFNKNGKEWYREIGITKAALSYNYQRYYNSTEFGTPWVSSNFRHSGFPSIMLGTGRIFNLPSRQKSRTFFVGIEADLRISHTLGGLGTTNFRLRYSSEKVTFPLFLRPNLGLTQHFKLFKKIPSYIAIYTKLSFQDIARGSQEITDVSTNSINTDGEYRLNYSEVGLQLYVGINKEYYQNWRDNKREKKGKQKRKGVSKSRVSLTTQLYQPKPTQYYIPQVDSFYLGGLRPFGVREIGLKMEFLHAKNEDWSTVVGISFGGLSMSARFRADSSFVADGIALNQTGDANLGNYLMPQIGLAYKHRLFKFWFQHSLSATFTIPFLEEKAILTVVERSSVRIIPSTLQKRVLTVKIDNNEFQTPVIPGLEYHGEVLFRLDKRIFFGVGFVFNKSFGSVTEGSVLVENDYNQYIGGFFQSFSKIGGSARIGVNLFDATKNY